MSPRFLVVRLGAMGDIVHALPAVASLRASFAGARIDWLIEPRWRELVELNPNVTNVLTADTRAWRESPWGSATWQSVRALRRTLRGADYDVALDFQGLLKSAALARLSGARRRLGFDWSNLKETAASAFYNESVHPAEGVHVVEMNLALAGAAGAEKTTVQFPLPVTPEDEAAVETMLAQHHLREFAVLSPGGGWRSKCWPVERYAQVHNHLARERGWRTVLNAGPGEEALVEEFIAQARVTRPVHLPLSLRQLVAMIRRARLLISGDTGPLHLAVALGTPVVSLYGPTDPARNGPYGGRSIVIHHRELATITYKHESKPSPAMLAITVEEVLAAVHRVLEQTGAALR